MKPVMKEIYHNILNHLESYGFKMYKGKIWKYNPDIGYIHTVPCQGQKLADSKRTGEGKVEAKLQPGMISFFSSSLDISNCKHQLVVCRATALSIIIVPKHHFLNEFIIIFLSSCESDATLGAGHGFPAKFIAARAALILVQIDIMKMINASRLPGCLPAGRFTFGTQQKYG